MSARGARACTWLLAVAAAGCMPVVEGPRLRTVPDGLGYLATLQAARPPLRHRAILRQLGYVPGPADWTSSVVITEYSGAAGAEEVAAARDDLARRYNSTEYSPLEEASIDGRPAWGWYETQRVGARVASVGYTAVVAYPKVSYGIEYSSHDPRTQGPRHLREVVLSFEVASSRRADGFMLIAAGVLLALGLWAALRSRAAPRSRPDTVDRLLPRR